MKREGDNPRKGQDSKPRQASKGMESQLPLQQSLPQGGEAKTSQLEEIAKDQKLLSTNPALGGLGRHVEKKNRRKKTRRGDESLK